ncbi:divalent-cation tolerance protein CutA, partial [bacterium]
LATTFPDVEAAERVGALLVDAGLAVCVQVGNDLRSVYRWQGKVEQSREVAVQIKVLRERYELCAGELKLQHPYDVPQIIGWPAGAVDDEYLRWAKGDLR